ncbi:WD40 repeat-like protein [Meredithblackwellia eburnea MCA 4105]
MHQQPQAHHFLPARRSPSPLRLRTAHQQSPLVDYLTALLPPPPPHTNRKRSRSASPRRVETLNNVPTQPHTHPPTRSQTSPLPPLRTPSPTREPPRPRHPPPQQPRTGRSCSPIPFPSLSTPIATANGETFEDVTTTNNAEAGGSGSPSKPGFSALTRTPSSAAFIAASGSGRVNPLTMQALARKGSEDAALKVFREREEKDRKWSEEDAEASNGGGGRPAISRKASWHAAVSSIGVGGSGGGGRDSPTGSGRRVSFFGGGGSTPPATSGSGGELRRQRDISQGSSSNNSEMGIIKPRDFSGSTITPSNIGRAPLVSSPTSSVPPSTSSTPSKQSSFISHPTLPSTPSRPSSAASTPEPPSRKSSIFKRLTRPRIKSNMSNSSSLVGSASSLGTDEHGVLSTSPPPVPITPTVIPGATSPAGAASEVNSPKLDKGKEKEKVRFVKVKSKGKATKDFGKLFLAQELFICPPSNSTSPPLPPTTTTPNPNLNAQLNGSGFEPSTSSDRHSIHSAHGGGGSSASVRTASHNDLPSTIGTTPAAATAAAASSGTMGRKKNAVWAIKFSLDGRYLAVGGKDGVVRIWEVLSTPETRQSAEHPDATDGPDKPSTPQVPQTPSSTTSKKKSANAGPSRLRTPVAAMPVFGTNPVQEWRGHEADVLDLSWSKNNFLLSSSMDKTVRLWHVSRDECLCAFQHLDFVTSIAFHPKDDRFFLSGSLDCKLRLWNIPEKRVHVWTELPELITSVAFSSDGKLAIAGSFVGVCMFFEVNTFHYHAQFAAKSTRGKNSKGRKVTSMVSMPVPSSGGERLLVTSNDSRMRLYHLGDKAVETKYAGHENTSSQIRASFSDDARFIISGSEDRHVYIWDSGLNTKPDGGFHFLKKKEGVGYEYFQMSANIITCATFAPSQTREVLSRSDDPIFSLGAVHLAPLRETISGAPLSAFPTTTLESGSPLVPFTNSSEHGRQLSAAEDCIIVVADDTTGVISVLRNSNILSEEVGSKLGRRRGSRFSEHSGSGGK